MSQQEIMLGVFVGIAAMILVGSIAWTAVEWVRGKFGSGKDLEEK